MTPKEVKKMIDKGAKLDKQIKALEEDLNEIKKGLREYAEKHKLPMIHGSKFYVKFSPRSVTECDAKKLFDFLKRKKKSFLFWSLVKVQITEAKKMLGCEQFNKLSTVQELGKFYTVSFKHLEGR